jgi:hypothetical protein
MKRILVLALAVATLTAGGAHANGSPYAPGLAYAWPGVSARDGVHYVTFGPTKWTVVAAIRARDGRVVRSNAVRGFYAVPLVAYNGVTGGLSGDGNALVLGSYGPFPGQAGKTRFAVLDTRTLAIRHRIVLDGSWSFDAVSPDARTLFLTEHVRAGDDPLYRIRTFDVRASRLGAPIVDRLEGERDMGGVPVARAPSHDGRWAYTLYARRGQHPFVHALDTVDREAYCIDLPLGLAYDKQWTLRLGLDASRRLSIWRAGGAVELASIDTATWKVKRTS